MPVYKNNDRGSWYVKFYYFDHTQKKRQKKKEGFNTKREALEWERDFLNKCKTDINITFANLVDNYLEDCKVRLKPTTFEYKECIIKSKLLPFFGDISISDIDTLTVRRWQNQIISDTNNYKPTYQKQLHNQLSAIFNYAVKYYKLSDNPARTCGSIGKKNADDIQFWTIDEFKQFIESVEDNITAKTIFNLLFFSGIREGELLALTLNDFDFDKNTVTINKSFARVKGNNIIGETKTLKSKRAVSLPIQIMEMIQNYAKCQYGILPTDRLFNVSKSYLQRVRTKYCKLSGVKRIRIHDFRHSYASMLINLGVSPLEVQERLGHEDIETTLNTYSHLYPNKHQETTNMLEKLLN